MANRVFENLGIWISGGICCSEEENSNGIRTQDPVCCNIGAGGSVSNFLKKKHYGAGDEILLFQ